jgi:hypothetical protein
MQRLLTSIALVIAIAGVAFAVYRWFFASQSFSDVLVGPQKDNTFPANPSGIRVGDLTPEKQALVVKAIETYVGDIFDDGAQMRTIKPSASSRRRWRW